eukprot:4323047-Pleurochrysis_carterae.AAC.1
MQHQQQPAIVADFTLTVLTVACTVPILSVVPLSGAHSVHSTQAKTQELSSTVWCFLVSSTCVPAWVSMCVIQYVISRVDSRLCMTNSKLLCELIHGYA